MLWELLNVKINKFQKVEPIKLIFKTSDNFNAGMILIFCHFFSTKKWGIPFRALITIAVPLFDYWTSMNFHEEKLSVDWKVNP